MAAQGEVNNKPSGVGADSLASALPHARAATAEQPRYLRPGMVPGQRGETLQHELGSPRRPGRPPRLLGRLGTGKSRAGGAGGVREWWGASSGGEGDIQGGEIPGPGGCSDPGFVPGWCQTPPGHPGPAPPGMNHVGR